MNIKKQKGTKDYFGLEAEKLNQAFEYLIETSELFGFEQVYLPVFEDTSLFKRFVGNTSDIVNKEMYTFEDKGGRSLTLRPEGTAQVSRMVLENKLVEQGKEQKFFYIENMYRYERPQKGRQREFIQYGLEWFGNDSIIADIQTIEAASEILEIFNVTKYEVQINSIGSISTRENYKKELKKYYSKFEGKLSLDSRERLKTNVLRILDSKDEEDIEINKKAPSIIQFLSKEELTRINNIKDTLIKLGINVVVNPMLVRGLDYYNDLVFEFVSTDEERLGSQSTILGGGRYDKLISQIDSSKNVPAVGFAIGIERLILASGMEDIEIPKLDFAIIGNKGDEVMTLSIAKNLRYKGNFSSYIDCADRSINKKVKKAKLNTHFIIEIIDRRIKIWHHKTGMKITFESIEDFNKEIMNFWEGVSKETIKKK